MVSCKRMSGHWITDSIRENTVFFVLPLVWKDTSYGYSKCSLLQGHAARAIFVSIREICDRLFCNSFLMLHWMDSEYRFMMMLLTILLPLLLLLLIIISTITNLYRSVKCQICSKYQNVLKCFICATL